ncbi:MAG TPA: DUF4129 domain-containing protein [Candidatus Dormibacteraeota bacterium]|nr:DUF4129 domain-containing protein [Candidatus Dormibacteraeota bacterium]
MTLRCTSILAALLIVSLFSRADTPSANVFTAAEYRAELDRLLAATQQLNSSGNPTPEALRHVPLTWYVHTDQKDFEISTEGLKRDVRRYVEEQNASNAIAIQTRLQTLRNDLDGFEKAPADVSARRTGLNAILARPEFRDVHGPTWADRLRQWLLDLLARIFRRLFRSSAIPTIGKGLVYALMGVALAALIYVAYRSIFRGQRFEEVVPKDLPVSAKEWTIWLSEARAAAARGEWRDAIHLAYWAGISFLERQGFWKPDRARTPREYLRLFSGSSEQQRETLTVLTRIFELAWYAKRDASERTFSQTLEQLEKLGCR